MTQVSRRAFLGLVGGAGVASAVGCTRGLQEDSGGAGKTIKIGYVSPRTGPLAAFGESDAYVLGAVRKALAGGVTVGDTKYQVEIVEKDTQSSSARAAQVAGELINQDNVDIVLCTSTPDTTNPVSEACEAARVPCVATICPWEIWFYQRGGSETKTFDYTYLYFIGTEREAELFAGLWRRLPGAHTVGGLWPNDVDGELYRRYVSEQVREAGWKLVPSGAYQDGTQDFTSIISTYKSGGVDILQATPIPPDWVTFWRQAGQNRFRPKLACVAKAMLFPSVAETLGPAAQNLVSPVWWTDAMPYKSSLDGTSAKDFAAGYQSDTGRQWTQPMGFNYAVFEVAVAALKASGDPKDPKAVADAIGQLKGEAITGRYDFTAGPVRNVSQAQQLMGQWRRDTAGRYNLVVVDNTADPTVPVQGDLQLLR
jgi:branched-chain amino acid transport system substrate-binding protein